MDICSIIGYFTVLDRLAAIDAFVKGNFILEFSDSTLIICFGVLSSHPTEDASKAAHMITHGTFRTTFWGGIVLFGNAIPLLLLIGNPELIVVATASALVLIGVWLSVRIWVLAPQMVVLS